MKCFGYSATFLIAVAMVLVVLKPACVFEEDRIRPFGVGPGETLFAFPVIVIAAGLISYFVFCAATISGEC